MTDVAACQALLGRLTTSAANSAKAAGASALVSSKELKAALGDEHWENYQFNRQYKAQTAQEVETAKHLLASYIEMLRLADFNDSIRDHASANGWSMKGFRMNSDAGYERAIEHLGELLAANPQISLFLDKAYDYGDLKGTAGYSRHDVPRPIHHRRQVYGHIDHQQIPSLKSLKIAALENALAAPQIAQVQAPQETTAEEMAAKWQRLKTLTSLIRR
jgi:hypothetical protein